MYWPQHELHEYCKKHGISLTSYASIGSPGRANFTLPNGECASFQKFRFFVCSIA